MCSPSAPGLDGDLPTFVSDLDSQAQDLAHYRRALAKRLTLSLVCDLIALYTLTRRYEKDLNARSAKVVAALGEEIHQTLSRRGVQLFLNSVILDSTMPEPTVDIHLESHVRSLEHALDRAFAELAEFRALLERQLTLPLIHDLIGLYHLCNRYRIEFVNERKGAKAMEILSAEILNALARKGVVPLEVHPGELLDRTLQRPVGVEACHDPGEDLQILSIQRPGFTSPGGVLAKAEVIVKRYTASPEAVLSTTGEVE